MTPTASQTTRAASTATGRRRPGGRGAGLTRGQIVERAIALMDAEGTAALTIRRLARELGVESAALYWHFADKAELFRTVVDTVGAKLRIATVTTGSARDRLEHHFVAIRDHWRASGVLELSRQHPPSAAVTSAGPGSPCSRSSASRRPAIECYRSLS
jgi:AcrR family transcriptional regulator